MSDPVKVNAGMLLAFERNGRNPQSGETYGPNYELHVVKSVRRLKNGDAKVKLLAGDEKITIESDATFPKGEVRDPFRVVNLGQRDLKTIWDGRDGD